MILIMFILPHLLLLREFVLNPDIRLNHYFLKYLDMTQRIKYCWLHK
jgi:hypothetical protein